MGWRSDWPSPDIAIAVYNRTRDKCEGAEKLGARVADSPADAARDADVVMLSLANQDVVRAMLYGDDGVFGSLRRAATSST